MTASLTWQCFHFQRPSSFHSVFLLNKYGLMISVIYISCFSSATQPNQLPNYFYLQWVNYNGYGKMVIWIWTIYKTVWEEIVLVLIMFILVLIMIRYTQAITDIIDPNCRKIFSRFWLWLWVYQCVMCVLVMYVGMIVVRCNCGM